jgi:integrase
MRNYNINRVDVRERLKLRREPYYQQVTPGRSIGFRKMTAKTGAWIARARSDDEAKAEGSGAYVYHPLGDDLREHADKDQYAEARRRAEAWFIHLDGGGLSKGTTVTQACKSRVEKVKSERSEAAATALEGYFRRLVYDDPIAKLDLRKAKKQHFEGFAHRVRNLCGLPLPDDHPGKASKLASYNRAMTPVRAAINDAWRGGATLTDQAWKEALKAESGRDVQIGKRRELYLTPEERAALIEKAPEAVKNYLRVMCALPLRPGEVANLHVMDFDARHGTLKVRGKTGVRDIPLGKPQVALLKELAKGKLPKAWIVSPDGKSQWTRWEWQDLIREAVTAAKLPTGTTAYVLRHCVLTDLISGGLDIVTASRLSGTSVAMIDKHYGKLQATVARAALDKLTVG